MQKNRLAEVEQDMTDMPFSFLTKNGSSITTCASYPKALEFEKERIREARLFPTIVHLDFLAAERGILVDVCRKEERKYSHT